MSAAIGQNFNVYQGDTAAPVITVTNGPAGSAIDISAAAEIAFTATRGNQGAAVLTKLKTTGGIAFVNSGTDGKLKVLLSPVDTAALLGTYLFTVKITDGAGAVTTVTVGTMQVGLAPQWTYDASQLTGTTAYAKLMQVRTLIADTNPKDQLLYDEQINFALAQRFNIYKAAADCCRQIAAKYSRDIDTVQGDLHRLYSARQKAFAARADELDQTASIMGGGTGYAGGISATDKRNQEANSDRVGPNFTVGMTDNWQPVGPVGPETRGGNPRDEVW